MSDSDLFAPVVQASATQIYAWYADVIGVETLTEDQKRTAHGMARLDPHALKRWIEAHSEVAE